MSEGIKIEEATIERPRKPTSLFTYIPNSVYEQDIDIYDPEKQALIVSEENNILRQIILNTLQQLKSDNPNIPEIIQDLKQFNMKKTLFSELQSVKEAINRTENEIIDLKIKVSDSTLAEKYENDQKLNQKLSNIIKTTLLLSHIDNDQ